MIFIAYSGSGSGKGNGWKDLVQSPQFIGKDLRSAKSGEHDRRTELM